MPNFNRTADGTVDVEITVDGGTERAPTLVDAHAAGVIQADYGFVLGVGVTLESEGELSIEDDGTAMRLNVPVAMGAAGEIGIDGAATMHRDNNPTVVRVYAFDNGDVWTFPGEPGHVVVDLSEP